MSKITYEQAALICLYNGITNTVSELENHYKSHPSKSIKEEILCYLDQQRDCLKLMMKSGINNCLLKSLSVNTKRLATKCKLKENNKIVSARAAVGTGICFATLLATFITVEEMKKMQFLEEAQDVVEEENALVETDFSSFDETLFRKIETESFNVSIEPAFATPLELDYKVYTLTMDQYYNVACPYDLQEYFYYLEEKWDIPADVGMLLVDKESNEQWTTNGVISPTNDYGLPQINKRNHAYIKRELGYTSDEILYDPYKSLDAMYLLLRNIFDHYGYTKDNYDLENVAGAYNGWTTWRSKSQSVDYVKACIDLYNDKFTDDEEVKLLVKEGS